MVMRFLSTLVGVFVVCLLASLRLQADPGHPGTGQRPPLGDVGKLPDDWDPETARNIKWGVRLGSQTFGAPVVADGKVFVGTNNGTGYLAHYPTSRDLSCLLCFRESDGKFLWQHSSEKLPTGRVHDWPLMGITCSPWVEGERAWFASNRGEVICLDTRGLENGDEGEQQQFEDSSVVALADAYRADLIDKLDAEKVSDAVMRLLTKGWRLKAVNDQREASYRVEVSERGRAWRVINLTEAGAPTFSLTLDPQGMRVVRLNTQPDPREADVIWRLNMMEKFGSRQHNNSTCCVTVWNDILFVCTGNGVDESHINIPAPDAPSFVALDKSTGRVLWTSNLPGKNIHHGNWASPAVGVLGGVPQVIFNGGDGWTYSFHAEEWHAAAEGMQAGQPKLLWKFDTNAKEAKLILGGRGTRNEPIGVPVLHEDRVYLTTGQDPEHGEGLACIWCIDATKRGDVSAELAVLKADPQTIVPHSRFQAVDPDKGQMAIPNPNSAVVWKYVGHDLNSNGKLEFEEQMHRTPAPVVIAGDLLFATDLSGLTHCLNRKTGVSHWTHDAFATIWTPPFVADGKVYITDEDGDIAIFKVSADPSVAGKLPEGVPAADRPSQIQPLREINMGNTCYTSPTASKGVLFIAHKSHLFAIETKPPVR